MSTFKRCQVVMLPTKKAVFPKCLWLGKYSNTLQLDYSYPEGRICDPVDSSMLCQHLYILSYEVIKKGDWYYVEELGNIQQFDKFPFEGEKIIATTDKSLELPEPSEGFIRVYIEAYNSGNPITEVDVEYLQYNYPHQPHNFVDHEEIKVNPKDNTITIRKIKNSWNMKEIYE